jgi:hypothetical protein
MTTVRRVRTSRGQGAASWIVLAALVAIAVWLYSRQSVLNPAVEVALRPPQLAGTVRPAGSQAFATASFLDAVSGVTPASAVESYDPDTLSDKIDGKAELYLAAHFKEMSCRAFTAPDGARVQAYVYAMDAPRDAFAVLSSQRRQGAAPSDVAPEAYQTENALYFTKGRHYVELVADRAGAETLAGLSAMGTALAGLLPGDTTGKSQENLAETELFPKDGLDAATLRLAAADAMGMAGFSNVYTADYALPEGQATAFLAVRATPDAAAADAQAFADFLAQNGYAKTPATGAPQGATVLGVDGSFEIIFTRGRVLAGVHDAVTLPAALDLAGRLSRALEGKMP